MHVRPWKNGLMYQEFPDGSAKTFRIVGATEECRGTSKRESWEDVKHHTPEEWAQMNAGAAEAVEAGETPEITQPTEEPKAEKPVKAPKAKKEPPFDPFMPQRAASKRAKAK